MSLEKVRLRSAFGALAVRLRGAFGGLACGTLAATLSLGMPGCASDGQIASENSTAPETVTKTQTVTIPRTTRTGDGESRTPTDAVASEPGNIRSIDWDAVTGARPLQRDVEDVIYADLTGDGAEEALVLVRVEGSGAYLDYYVYQLQDDELVDLFQKVEVSHGRVELGPLPLSFVESTAVYGPGDPNCCPSNIMYTTYQWSASARVFTAVTVEMAPNPQAEGNWKRV